MAKLVLRDLLSGFGLLTKYNANNSDIEEAIENTLSRDGTGPNDMQASLDMGGHRVLNAADAVSSSDLVTLGQLPVPSAEEAILTQDLLAPLLNPRTDEEIEAGVTPVNYEYPALNVLRYGADPSGGSSSDDAIGDAIAVAEEMNSPDSLNNLSGGARIFFPEGRYAVSSPRVWTKRGLTFQGAGRGTIIFADATFIAGHANRGIFQSRETSDRGASATTINAVFRDMSIYGLDPETTIFDGTSNVRGIWITGLDGFSGPCGFYNVHFRGLGIDIVLAGAWRFTIQDCAFVGGRQTNKVGTGLSFASTSITDAEGYDGSFNVNVPMGFGNRFQYLGRSIEWVSGMGGGFVGTTIEQNDGGSLGTVNIGNVDGASFLLGYHEGNVGAVYSVGTASGRANNCNFDGFFTGRSAGTNTSDYFLQNVENCTFRGKHSGSSPGSDVLTATSNFFCERNDIRYATLDESNNAIDRDLNIVHAYTDDIRTDSLYPNRRTENLQNADYTLLETDAGKVLRHTSGSAHAWTIPPGVDAPMLNGSTVDGENAAAGVVTITRGAGVTLNLFTGSAVNNQNVAVALGGWFHMRKVSANVWNIHGAGLS